MAKNHPALKETQDFWVLEHMAFSFEASEVQGCWSRGGVSEEGPESQGGGKTVGHWAQPGLGCSCCWVAAVGEVFPLYEPSFPPLELPPMNLTYHPE